jgi:hypothetical protein
VDSRGHDAAGKGIARTHALEWRVPFDVRGTTLSFDGSEAKSALFYRSMATPLLARDGSVELLVRGDGKDTRITPTGVTLLDEGGTRRFGRSPATPDPGLVLDKDRVLVLEDGARSTDLEERGPSPERPAVYVGAPRELVTGAAEALGERGDGAIGLLVVDAPIAGAAGFARFDRVASSFGAIEPLAPWSSLVAGDDPRCRPRSDEVRALLAITPARWIELDARVLPGVTFAGQGMVLVRFSKERVCLDALDAAVTDARSVETRSQTLVFDAREKPAALHRDGIADAAILAPPIRQSLHCVVAPSIEALSTPPPNAKAP